MVSCNSCKYSRANNGLDEWCVFSQDHSCQDHTKYEPVGRRIPRNPVQCGDMYVDECDIPDGLCLVCPCSRVPYSHGDYCPLGAGNIKEAAREEIIVVGNRYYQPQQEQMIEQIVPFPVLVEEE